MKRYRWWLIGALSSVLLVAGIILFLRPAPQEQTEIFIPDYSYTPKFKPKDFEAALAWNRALWESKRIFHYTFSIDLGWGWDLCQTPCMVEVKNDEVVSITYSNGVAIPTSEFPEYEFELNWFLTVPALFSFVEQTFQERPPDIRVEYDSVYGYPTYIYVDPYIEPCCQDYWITIKDLHTLP